MTEGGHGEEPLTPEEEAEVARLLTEAGGPLRMPDDVAARLAGVLADLQSERSEVGGTEVVALSSRRRRGPRLLLAAAAVVVGGYAVGTVATQGTLSGSGDSLSAGAADDSGSVEEAPGAASPEDAGGSSSGKDRANLSSPEAAGERTTGSMLGRLVRVRSDRLELGVRRALRVLGTDATSATEEQGYDDRADPACLPPGLGRGDRSLPVLYDGGDAVLVAGRERRGTVEVTIWSCTGEELDSTVVDR